MVELVVDGYRRYYVMPIHVLEVANMEDKGGCRVFMRDGKSVVTRQTAEEVMESIEEAMSA